MTGVHWTFASGSYRRDNGVAKLDLSPIVFQKLQYQ
jgi:hypothetical protein